MTNAQYNLIENAPEFAKETAALFSWSENYDYPSPATLFLDLIGYTEENYGEPLYDLRKALGYLEIGMLADAMREYANNPQPVMAFVESLMAPEDEEAE